MISWNALCLLLLLEVRPGLDCTGGDQEGDAGVSPQGLHPVPGSLQKCHSTRVGQDMDHEQEGKQSGPTLLALNPRDLSR